MTEIDCVAHARCRFFDLHVANQSQIAEQAMKFFSVLCDVEREAAHMMPQQWHAIRQERAKLVADSLHTSMIGQREGPEGSTIVKAIDYSLKRWAALTRYLDDGGVLIANNWVENQIRPWAIARSTWLFAWSLRAG